jgi:serine/threonine-protein kinase HipA
LEFRSGRYAGVSFSTIAAQVGKAGSTWRDEPAWHGIGRAEIDRMATAFEHEDLKKAGK